MEDGLFFRHKEDLTIVGLARKLSELNPDEPRPPGMKCSVAAKFHCPSKASFCLLIFRASPVMPPGLSLQIVANLSARAAFSASSLLVVLALRASDSRSPCAVAGSSG